jgi:hypothetical protein
MNDTVRVILHNQCTATIEIKDASQPDMEQEIAQRLRSPEPLPWTNDPEGIKADIILQTRVLRPRRRFILNNDEGGEQ